MEGLRSQRESVEFISLQCVIHQLAFLDMFSLSIPLLSILLFLIFKNFCRSLVALRCCVSFPFRSESAWNAGDPGLIPGSERREGQLPPVFLPEEFHRQRSMAGYSPLGLKELNVTKRLNNNRGPNFLIFTPWTVSFSWVWAELDSNQQNMAKMIGCHRHYYAMLYGQDHGIPFVWLLHIM